MLRYIFAVPAVGLAMDIPTQEIAPGVQIPVLSIGTGGFEMSKAQQIVTTWLGLGGRGIDTAYVYGNQDAVKDAIKSSGLKRQDVFITTKIPGCTDVSKNVLSDLTDLGTDYIDLLLIHFPRGDCVTAWKTLEDYYKNGTAKAIGVSNFKKSNLQQIIKGASVVPHVNQIELNVLENDGETIAFAMANNITTMAFSPLGRASGDIPSNAKIQSVAANHNVSTYQVALKWILQHGHVLTFQSSSRDHQQQDADIFGFTLTATEMSELDKLSVSSQSHAVTWASAANVSSKVGQCMPLSDMPTECFYNCSKCACPVGRCELNTSCCCYPVPPYPEGQHNACPKDKVKTRTIEEFYGLPMATLVSRLGERMVV